MASCPVQMTTIDKLCEAYSCDKLPPVPDINDHRYCRACQTTLPITAFPVGRRRYLCKRHIWERIQRPSKQRALANTDKKQLWLLWKRCWIDAKKSFGHDRITLVQRDIADKLSKMEDKSVKEWTQHSMAKRDIADTLSQVEGKSVKAWTKHSMADSESDAVNAPASITKPESTNFALLPADPQSLVSRENVVVVDKGVRRKLLQAFRIGGPVRYVDELRGLA